MYLFFIQYQVFEAAGESEIETDGDGGDQEPVENDGTHGHIGYELDKDTDEAKENGAGCYLGVAFEVGD